ncbi:cytochrome B561 [Ancylobacter novellus DSM 506]|uniref:Cytochrome B561 n=1 Tax=Ancylobacter novellus (strain ATCC 8093 / DSM 506 / JCM 20403 / CCM 1077 / IAM 12100 / NBRC 12443 / NCIMB 10456) TaxID=639283 RepID=D7A5S6_ANCN5|nr:cytochrome b [Ancylobacter novellus]ADH90041.1 cytochrome B561 [Ancylobacter novellus DSM 506]
MSRTPSNPPVGDHYSLPLRALHWLTVLAVSLVYGVPYIEGFFERGTAGRAFIWWAHISVGLLILGLVALRLAARALGPVPPPSAALSRPVHLAATAAHVLLYVLLVVTPVVGIYLAFLRGDAVTFFGLFTIPSPVAVDREAARQVIELHETLANVLVVLALLHGLAALVHHFVFRDDVLRRMLPRH